MSTTHAVTYPFLGRRWKARCERCRIDLPGRYTSRGDAERAGTTHAELRHSQANSLQLQGKRLSEAFPSIEVCR